MGSSAFLARLQMRRRVWNLVVIAVVLAIVGGIAMSLVAGSRRSSSVVRRYFDTSIPYDFLIYAPGMTRAQVEALPGVARADYDGYVGFVRQNADGTQGGPINGVTFDAVGIDPTFQVLDGQLPAPDDADSVIVNESFAEEFGLGAGDPVTVRAFAPSDEKAVSLGKYVAHGPVYRFRIGAVTRSPFDIALDEVHTAARNPKSSSGGMLVPGRFYEAHRSVFLDSGAAYDVKLDSKASARRFPAVLQQAAEAAGGFSAVGPARFAERPGSFKTPVRTETSVLLGLGLATAIAGLIVVSLLLRAEQQVQRSDAVILRALGATRAQLGSAAVLRTAPFVFAGAIAAAVLAFGLSGRYPIGMGRKLELEPGFDANLTVIIGATLGTAIFLLALAYALERTSRVARDRRVSTRMGASSWLARWGAPADVVIGAHFAFKRGDADNPVPARSAIAGGAVALALVVAIAVFVAGTNDLYGRSSAHGWPWDAVVGNVNFDMSEAREAKLVADPRVERATKAKYGQATVGKVSTEVLAIDPRGAAPPDMLSGRLPRGPAEIALGAKLRDSLHARVGDKVRFSVVDSEFVSETSGPATDRDLTVVGVALPPVLGESELGEGAIVTLAAIKAAGGAAGPQLVLAKLRDPDRPAAAGLVSDYTPDVVTDTIPSRVVNLHAGMTPPRLGALLAAVLGTALLAYTLVVSARARTRQLGVLRALGMTPSRVGRVITWQGVALALAIALIGIPAGLLIGSLVWRIIASELGVSDRPVISLGVLALLPAAVGLGALAAVVPARRVRHDDVGALLRAE